MGQIWDSQRREWEDRQLAASQRRLRPIIPLVFYTGERRWSTPLGLAHLMDLPAELERFVPRWEMLFLNLQQTPTEALTQFATALGWALRVWQAEKAPLSELAGAIREAMAGLEGLAEEQAGQWLRIAWFLLLLMVHRQEERELTELVLAQARLSKFGVKEEVEKVGLTVVEQWEAQGAEKMLRANLMMVLTTRFGDVPAEIEAAIAVANTTAMDRWLRRALTSATLDEIGVLSEAAAG